MQSRERAGESADFVADHRVAERRVLLDVLIGVDDDRSDLRRKTRDHVRNHRRFVERNQALVDAAHAPALAAGEDEPRDVTWAHRSAPAASLRARNRTNGPTAGDRRARRTPPA